VPPTFQHRVRRTASGERRASHFSKCVFSAKPIRALWLHPGGPSPRLWLLVSLFQRPSRRNNFARHRRSLSPVFSFDWAARSGSLRASAFEIVFMPLRVGRWFGASWVWSQRVWPRCSINFQPPRISRKTESADKPTELPIRCTPGEYPAAKRLKSFCSREATVFPRVLGLPIKFIFVWILRGQPSVCKQRIVVDRFFKTRIDRKPVDDRKGDMVRCGAILHGQEFGASR